MAQQILKSLISSVKSSHPTVEIQERNNKVKMNVSVCFIHPLPSPLLQGLGGGAGRGGGERRRKEKSMLN